MACIPRERCKIPVGYYASRAIYSLLCDTLEDENEGLDEPLLGPRRHIRNEAHISVKVYAMRCRKKDKCTLSSFCQRAIKNAKCGDGRGS